MVRAYAIVRSVTVSIMLGDEHFDIGNGLQHTNSVFDMMHLSAVLVFRDQIGPAYNSIQTIVLRQ